MVFKNRTDQQMPTIKHVHTTHIFCCNSVIARLTNSPIFLLGTTVFAVSGILSRAAEFARFHRISTFPQNFAEFCNGGWEREKYGIFWLGLGSRGKLITTCRHDCTIKYITISSSNVRNIENIEFIWNTACLFGRQTVSVSCSNILATNTAYFIGFRGRRKLLPICGKFAAALAEFGKICRRKLWSLILIYSAVYNSNSVL